MRKSFLIKVVFLVIALAGVSAVIAITLDGSFGTDTTGPLERKLFLRNSL